LDADTDEGDISVNLRSALANPEETTSEAELVRLLEQSILGLPEQYRTVLTLRDVEELNTSETAAALGLSEENVKVRLHRARALLRTGLLARIGTSTRELFPFMGQQCDRVVEGVFARLSKGAFRPS